MSQAQLAVPLLMAVALASTPAEARLATRSLLAPRQSQEFGAAALTGRGHARGWLLAQAERYDVIKTKDGQVHIGKILRETAKGYLFAEGNGATVVIDFEQVANISNTADAAAPPPQPVHPAQPVPPSQQLAPPPAPAASPVDTARVYELMRERAELEADSPSIGGPIAALIIGGGLIPIGYFVTTGFGATGGTLIAVVVTGVTVVILGSILVLVGGIKLLVNIIRRITRSARMNSIDDELERLKAPRAIHRPLDGPSPEWLVAVF